MSIYEESPYYNRELIPLEEFDCATQTALDNYNRSAKGERKDFKDHAVRVRSLVKAFAGDELPPEAVSLALIHDVVDRLINDKSTKYNKNWAKQAAHALFEMFDNEAIGHDQLKYAACILVDLVKVEQSAAHHRKEMAEIAKEDVNSDSNFSKIYPLIAERYMGDISPEEWKIAQPLLNLNHMRWEMEKVNIEAIIIKGAELLDNLRYPSSKRRSAILQDVLEAESFYAPILEAMGYEGFAAELRSVAKIRRLIGQNKESLVDRASEIQSLALQAGIDNIANKIFGVNDGMVSYAVGKDETTDNYPIHMGEFVAETELGNMIAGNWRIKSVGSIADKLNDGEGIMDIVGMMVISNNEEASARDFAHFISHRLKEFNPIASRSKKHPVYIQGKKEYVDRVIRHLHESGVSQDQYQVKIDDEYTIEKRGYPCYEVSKVTFSTEVNGIEVPVEIQFVTKDERQRARTGVASHIGYKYLKAQGYDAKKLDNETAKQRRERLDVVYAAEEVLSALYNRRNEMKEAYKNGGFEVKVPSEDNQDHLLSALVELLA